MKNLLEKKRREIDGLDARLAGLLVRRLRLAGSLKSLKEKVRDPEREAEVLAGVSANAKDRKLVPALLAVYREIIRQSRGLQEKK